MVFVGHHLSLSPGMRQAYQAQGYRVVANPAGGWDVYLDPPADVLGPPLVEAIDDETGN